MDVTLPNGQVIRGVPDGTNKWAIAEKAITAGIATPEDFGQQSYSPTDDMSGFQKYRAGFGKAFVDIGRGAGQKIGLTSTDDVASARQRDQPLMKTGAGLAGNVTGNVAAFAPTAFVPGANTLVGAGAIGAGIGLLQPAESLGEGALNTALGGVAGPVGLLAGRGLAATYRGGKALVEPFFKGGQQRIAQRTLQAFAGGRNEAATAAQNISKALPDQLPGAQPTTAELARNPGLAQLERTMRNNPEVSTKLTGQIQSTRNVILDALDDVARPGQREAAVAAREAATESLYNVSKPIIVEADDALRALMGRPSMSKAFARASALASERGDVLRIGVDLPEQLIPSNVLDQFGKPLTTTSSAQSSSFSGKALHYIKMAMDDLVDNPQVNGIGGNEVSAIRSTQKELIGWIGKKIPVYDKARTTYAAMSKPINQMDIGRALRDKLQPALADFGADTRMRPQSFAQALRSGDKTAASVLKRRTAKINDVLTPDQMDKLNRIGRQLARRTVADELGRGPGSNTGQNIVSQNVLRQLLGPLGLPETTMQRAAESTFLQSVMRPAQWAGSLGEQRVMNVLADAVADPAQAQKMLEAGIKPEVMQLLRYQGLLPPVAAAVSTSQVR